MSDSGGNASINTMPDEILLKIFSHLPTKTTAFVVPGVCTRWEKISTDTSLYRNLRLGSSYLTRKQIVYILTNLARDLKSLTLGSERDINELLEIVALNNSKIQSLKVFYCNINSSSVILLIITNCTALQELRFHNTNASWEPELFKRLAHLRQLTSFEPGYFDTWNYPIDIVSTIATSISEQRLEQVRLFSDTKIYYRNAVTHESMLTLIAKHNNSLKTLKLNASKLTNDSMAAIASCNKLTSMKLTWLSLHGVNDQGLRCLGNLNLTRLNITERFYTSAETWTWLFMQDSLKGLVSLTLWRCSLINDMVLNAIGDLKGLKKLVLKECGGVTDRGYDQIKKLLPYCMIFYEGCEDDDDDDMEMELWRV